MSPPPGSYYDMLEERLPNHGEPTEELRARGILLDGSTADNHPRFVAADLLRESHRTGYL